MTRLQYLLHWNSNRREYQPISPGTYALLKWMSEGTKPGDGYFIMEWADLIDGWLLPQLSPPRDHGVWIFKASP